jgi:hypothetical protein
MALLKDTKYIKLEQNGQVSIYKSAEARQRHKAATSSDKIILKYKELILEYQTQLTIILKTSGVDLELLNSDPTLQNKVLKDTEVAQILKLLDIVSTELYYYETDLSKNKGAQHEFPIMEKYFPDVKDSIPHIIEGCFLV